MVTGSPSDTPLGVSGVGRPNFGRSVQQKHSALAEREVDAEPGKRAGERATQPGLHAR
jgi:hypothetical protein